MKKKAYVPLMVSIVSLISCVKKQDVTASAESQAHMIPREIEPTMACRTSYSYFKEMRAKITKRAFWGLSVSEPVPPPAPELLTSIVPVDFPSLNFCDNNYMKEQVEQVESKLSKSQIEALNLYTSDRCYRFILQALRPANSMVDCNRNHWSEFRGFNWKKIAAELESALAMLPKVEGTIYRGEANLSHDRLQELVEIYQNGKEFYFGIGGQSTLASASLKFAPAYYIFSRCQHSSSTYSTVFIINQKSGRFISTLSPGREHESEVLIPANTPFEIVGFQPIAYSSKLLVFLEEK
jgi:hypothetical protein